MRGLISDYLARSRGNFPGLLPDFISQPWRFSTAVRWRWPGNEAREPSRPTFVIEFVRVALLHCLMGLGQLTHCMVSSSSVNRRKQE